MRESRTPGSVRGVLSNEHPYRDGVGSADSDPDPRGSTHDPLAPIRLALRLSQSQNALASCQLTLSAGWSALCSKFGFFHLLHVELQKPL